MSNFAFHYSWYVDTRLSPWRYKSKLNAKRDIATNAVRFTLKKLKVDIIYFDLSRSVLSIIVLSIIELIVQNTLDANFIHKYEIMYIESFENMHCRIKFKNSTCMFSSEVTCKIKSINNSFLIIMNILLWIHSEKITAYWFIEISLHYKCQESEYIYLYIIHTL